MIKFSKAFAEQKITVKPWGKEIVLELNDDYMVKRIYLDAGQQTSLHYHTHKCETLYVVRGVMRLEYSMKDYERESVYLKAGDSVTLYPCITHRMIAIEACEYIECSTPHPDDVTRIEDTNGRLTQ